VRRGGVGIGEGRGRRGGGRGRRRRGGRGGGVAGIAVFGMLQEAYSYTTSMTT